MAELAITIFIWPSKEVTPFLYGIGGMNQTQRNKIKGLLPVGVVFNDGQDNAAPCYYKSEGNDDANIWSRQFMSQTLLRGSIINNVASNDLHIQPPNMY